MIIHNQAFVRVSAHAITSAWTYPILRAESFRFGGKSPMISRRLMELGERLTKAVT